MEISRPSSCEDEFSVRDGQSWEQNTEPLTLKHGHDKTQREKEGGAYRCDSQSKEEAHHDLAEEVGPRKDDFTAGLQQKRRRKKSLWELKLRPVMCEEVRK
ncbi:hypothetical protein EYF80_053738 [Liparis tanakae]|uniref:Uncharacterized protein n=1 Tax=Liparis tanakae TaxID=230148 RepID=A0A4Z2F4Q6_9TELE|nr:hypothetical protein EYF80_053738 [Liparis tanakae]